MPPIRVKHITSFSSQDPKHTVEDLVRGRGSWLSQAGDKSGRLQADLQLEWATTITYIDVGNAGSVMVSVEVGRSCWPASHPLVTLLPAASLISPGDWRSGKNKNTVRMFRPDDMDSEARREKWDRVRIVCLQPFRKDGQFGLSLFRLHTNAETGKEQSSDIVLDFEVDTTKSGAKKEELVSKMNLPIPKKTTISQKIGWLENRVLSRSDDPDTSANPNPITSPVSRAARLLSMATSTLTKEAADGHKQTLEHEALDFLISLNLSISDIYSLKVISVRQEFEKKRKEELDYKEKVIFKEIALDYAKRRLEILENKEEKKSSVESAKKNGYINHRAKPVQQSKKDSNSSPSDDFDRFEASKKAMSGSENPRSSTLKPQNSLKMSGKSSTPAKSAGTRLPENSESQGKFTFRSTGFSENSLAQLKRLGKSPGQISKKRQKLREEEDLSEPLPSSSRNNIALADSKVTTPMKSKSVRGKKTKTPRSRGKKKKSPTQSTLGVWITPKTKGRKENEPFSLSRRTETQSPTQSKDDDDLVVLSDDDVSLNISGKGDTGGGFLNDSLSFQLVKIDDTYKSVGEGQKTASTSSLDNSGAGELGYCLNAAPVDKYGVARRRAARQGVADDTDSDTTSSLGGVQNVSTMVECPLCLGFFPSTNIQAHAASCGNVSPQRSDTSDEDFVQAEMESTTEEASECPVCGKIVMKSELENHVTDCAAAMFD